MLTATNIFNKIDRACGTTSTSYTLANKAIDVNQALDDIYIIGLKARGWNTDDFNHTKDPFITIDMVDGQRDYHFTYDEESAMVLDILKVMAKDASGVYQLLTPVAQDEEGSSFYDGRNTEGTPTHYRKTGNGIYLDPIPSYNSTAGLKIYINRTPTYFTSSDTTKVAGVDGLVHDYLYLKPSYEYARDHGLQNRESLFRDLQVALANIDKRYGRKEQDVRKRLTPLAQNNK